MKWILSLLICWSASAQLPVIPYNLPSSSTWYPTNTASRLVFWFELIPPLNGTWGPDIATHPAGDNISVKLWTNYAQASSQATADQTLHPTNYVSGGGANGTSPRVLFTANTSTRMVVGSQDSRSVLTFIFVCNVTDSTAVNYALFRNSGATDPWIRFDNNGTALELNAGTALTGPTTLTVGTWYVVTAIFNGASSEIDTNGVLYKSGNAGTDPMNGCNLGEIFTTSSFRGNISRFWGWTNLLSGAELSAAVAQCKTDFGIH